MKVSEIIDGVRGRIDDVEQSTWGDQEMVDDYLNDAIEELCRRTEILTDSSTVGEVLSSATITLGAFGGSIASVTVNGVVVTSAAVAFNTDLTTTAAALASNINAYTSSPDYTATSSGAVVTIKAKAGTGANPNGYVVSVSITGMTATVTNMAGGTSLCQIYLLPGISVYSLDSRVIDVERVKPSLLSWPIQKKTKAWLDHNEPGWEKLSGDPKYFLPSDTGKIRIVPKPKVADTVDMDITRLPLAGLSYTNMNVSPEIPTIYHRNLFSGVLCRAYAKLRHGQMVNAGRVELYRKEWDNEVAKIGQDIIRRKLSVDTACPPVPTGGRQRGGVRGVVI